ncbi:MAG TPA: hypothetical protein VII38_04750 [Polyangia bacterium]
MRRRSVFFALLLYGCAPPAAMMAGDAGAPAAADAGAVTIGPSGPLSFAVFGDTRPPNLNDTAGYPSAIVAGDFALMAQKGARFAVGTGDYMFANADQAVQAQVALFQTAEGSFPAPIYLAMGNHECTGATASNCPSFAETFNVRGFMSRLLPPAVALPYYRVDVDTPHGKAKFVFIAANAWSSAQAEWLTAQMADPTTYTFVVRHEAPSVKQTPGVAPSEAIVNTRPFTLELLGHSHRYQRLDADHVISGNGGAPMDGLSGGTHYGFLLISQLDDGNLSVTEIDEASGNALDAWRVTPDGFDAP